jgi:7-cyano-7-deazaguanine synthase
VTLAVLISGGLDSAILLGDMLAQNRVVQPISIRCGLAWEEVEHAHLVRYLAALGERRLDEPPGLSRRETSSDSTLPVGINPTARQGTLLPLVILDEPVGDLYGDHWSVTGKGVPGATDPDPMVFLPGRNILLLAKAMLWCHLHRVPAIALGSLGTNPFPDATPEFFRTLQSCVNLAVEGRVEIVLPYGGMKKTDVMRRGVGLPLELSFSCIDPVGDRHCGRCNKCAERQAAFRDAGMPDPTPYA